MPIYEFQCTACKHLFEDFFNKVSTRPSAKCPECGGKAKKLISNVGIVFKGSGFYVTDSRTQPAGGSSSSKSTLEKSESKSETASESKGTETPSTDSGSEKPSGEKKSGSEKKSEGDSGSKKKSKSSED